jgi:hypothetical protein
VNGNGKADFTRIGGGMSNQPSINIINLGKPSYERVGVRVSGTTPTPKTCVTRELEKPPPKRGERLATECQRTEGYADSASIQSMGELAIGIEISAENRGTVEGQEWLGSCSRIRPPRARSRPLSRSPDR